MPVATVNTIEAPGGVIIAANPRAGAGSPTSKVEQLAGALRACRLSVQILTDLAEVTAETERQLAHGTLRALVAAGGDGTVAELVNRTPAHTPITVFPLGTANLLAGYLGISTDIPRFCRTICHGRYLTLDAGRANGRIFLLMAGCGFDGEVVDRLHRVRRGGISMWSYAKPIIDSIRSYTYPELRIGWDAAPGVPMATTSATARWAFVVNLPPYAARVEMAPWAVGNDGLLELCTFRHGSLWHGLRYLGYIWTGRHARLPDFACQKVQRVRIEADRPVRYQLDGDPGGLLPLDIEMLPGRLNLLAPAECPLVLDPARQKVTERV